MQFQSCDINGVWLIDPAPHLDERGRFMRAWCSREFEEHGILFTPVQGNMGYSARQGTIRGMHFQTAPALEAKLVRCTRGSLFDVAVDLRPESATYLSWFGTHLSADNGRMLHVPEGCAHGCLSLEDETEFLYLASAYYTPSQARGVRYDDPAFNIEWPKPPMIVSAQDRSWPLIDLARP